jgi:hypothetical protein
MAIRKIPTTGNGVLTTGVRPASSDDMDPADRHELLRGLSVLLRCRVSSMLVVPQLQLWSLGVTFSCLTETLFKPPKYISVHMTSTLALKPAA